MTNEKDITEEELNLLEAVKVMKEGKTVEDVQCSTDGNHKKYRLSGPMLQFYYSKDDEWCNNTFSLIRLSTMTFRLFDTTLSYKVIRFASHRAPDPRYWEEDVKKAIQKIKESIKYRENEHILSASGIYSDIDKIVGERLK